MAPKQQSLWQRKRTTWYREAARTKILEEAVWLLGLFAMASIGLFYYGFTHSDTTGGRLALVGSALCLVTFVGLRRGQQWSRFIGGAVAAVLATLPVFGILNPTEISISQWFWGIGYGVMWGMTAYFLLGPRSRALFEQARTGEPLRLD